MYNLQTETGYDSTAVGRGNNGATIAALKQRDITPRGLCRGTVPCHFNPGTEVMSDGSIEVLVGIAANKATAEGRAYRDKHLGARCELVRLSERSKQVRHWEPERVIQGCISKDGRHARSHIGNSSAVGGGWYNRRLSGESPDRPNQYHQLHMSC